MVYPEIGHGAGLGFMSSIKIVKAVRVSRILRLLQAAQDHGQNTQYRFADGQPAHRCYFNDCNYGIYRRL
jgi:hypothetical protein